MQDIHELSALERGKLLWQAHKSGAYGSWKEIADHYNLNVNTARREGSDWNRHASSGRAVRILMEQHQMPEREVRELYPDLDALMGLVDEADEEDMREADIEELVDIIRRTQRQFARLDPVITHRRIEIPSDRPVPILLAGCFQTGGRWTFHSFIQRKLDEMFELTGARAGFFGDEVEQFLNGSFAGARSVYEQALTPPLQRKLWSHWMDKYADRILWGTSSQHGTQWNERLGFNPIKDKYLEHGIPFFDGQFYLELVVGDVTYRMAGSHEFPGSSMYNKLHAQKRALWQRFPNADIVAQADKHQYAWLKEDAYGQEYLAGNRGSPWVWLLQIGTAKSGPDPYTVRSWERGVSEWPWLILSPDRHHIRVTDSLEEVVMATREREVRHFLGLPSSA